MPKPEWGVKRLCPGCSARFYDLGRDPATCPSCGRSFAIVALEKPRRGRTPVKAPLVAKPKVDAPEPDDVEDVIEVDDDNVLDLDDDDDVSDDSLPEAAGSDADDDAAAAVSDFSDDPIIGDGDDAAGSDDDDDDDDGPEVSLESLEDDDVNDDPEDET